MILSIIVPVYLNEHTLIELAERVKRSLASPYELIFVDDASPDGSFKKMERLAQIDPSIKIIKLEKNKGQHKAVMEGLRNARGKIALVMDADLQDRPEELQKLANRILEGFDGVFASRRGVYESGTRSLQSKIFKFLLNKSCGAPRDAGMFLAMSRRMVDFCLDLCEVCPFPIVTMALSKFPITSIPVERSLRLKGSSAYSFWKRLMLARQVLNSAQKLKRYLSNDSHQISK